MPSPVPLVSADEFRELASRLRPEEIARELGVHWSTPYRWARKWRIPFKRGTRTPTRDEWKLLIVEHGLSVRALAKATGLRRSYVREVLAQHGLLPTYFAWRGNREYELTPLDML